MSRPSHRNIIEHGRRIEHEDAERMAELDALIAAGKGGRAPRYTSGYRAPRGSLKAERLEEVATRMRARARKQRQEKARKRGILSGIARQFYAGRI